MPTDEGDKPRYRVRLVANQIAPHSHALLARLTKTKPTFFATPGQASFEAMKATEVAESLLEYWWDHFHLASKREEAMLWAIICGNGFWKISLMILQEKSVYILRIVKVRTWNLTKMDLRSNVCKKIITM